MIHFIEIIRIFLILSMTYLMVISSLNSYKTISLSFLLQPMAGAFTADSFFMKAKVSSFQTKPLSFN